MGKLREGERRGWQVGSPWSLSVAPHGDVRLNADVFLAELR